MTLPNSDAPTAAIDAVAKALGGWWTQLWPSEVREGAEKALDALAAAFPHLVFDVTDPEQLKQAGFRQVLKKVPGQGMQLKRYWLAPERETKT